MFCIALAVLKQLSLNLILIILIITTVLVGGVLPLIERKFLSLIQRRVGPNIVGYRGRLQFLADALKLFLKEVITIQSANRRAAFLLPTVFLVTNLLILFFLV
jgi:NADH:ubiquinone oxidoreductase subunit H